jgi:hypothetical protein
MGKYDDKYSISRGKVTKKRAKKQIKNRFLDTNTKNYATKDHGCMLFFSYLCTQNIANHKTKVKDEEDTDFGFCESDGLVRHGTTP